ncbi:MAG: ubiquinol oxidase subunit II [Comamonas sp.]
MPDLKKLRGPSRLVAALLAAGSLAGCNAVVFNPAGDVALQSGNLVIIATLLMLIIIIPVMILIVYFAWKYRETNEPADYDPEWHHSTTLELIIWSVPLLIVIALGALTWIYTHKLDPYRPLDRIDASRPVPADMKPLEVEVVAMDWKWLFIYPEQGIATINELAAPVDRPIRFKLTSTTTMNAFYVPDLAGMIYAMPSMETQLNAVVNKTGVFKGMSSHYSGAGFAGMTFKFHGLSNGDFDAWVQKAKTEGKTLNRAEYLNLEKPSERDPVRLYANVDDTLYHAILNRCVPEGKMCMDEIMAKDAVANFKFRAAAGKSASLLIEDDVCTAGNAAQVVATLRADGAEATVTQ